MGNQPEIFRQEYAVSRHGRTALLNRQPLALRFAGLPGAGKTTLAALVLLAALAALASGVFA